MCFAGGNTFHVETARLGFAASVRLAAPSSDPEVLAIVLADGSWHDVPATRFLALADPRYRKFLSAQRRAGATPGDSIRALRRAAGRNAMEVAAAAGMTRGNSSRLEAGKHEPRLATLRRVAEALRCRWRRWRRCSAPAIRSAGRGRADRPYRTTGL